MADVFELAKKRDGLNLSVKKGIEAIRGKMAEMKALNESAKKLKIERDSKNKIVAEFRKKRDALNADAKKAIAELKKIDAGLKKLPRQDGPLDVLQKNAKELDWKIQTEHRSIKKDEELRDKLEEIEKEIASGEKRSGLLSRRAEISRGLDKVREEAETIHSLIVDNSQAAKKAHEELISIYSRIKAIRAEVAPASKDITDLKKQANEAHGALVEAKKNVHESQASQRMSRASAAEEKMRIRAKELMDEFSHGKKLSTEEILIIQKFGD